MKHRIIIYFALLGFIIALTSCEGNTDRSRQIENNTSGLITVFANGSNVSNYDNTISAGETETLFISNQLGGSDYVETPATGISSLIIINAAGDTCLKDYLPKDNWEISVEQTKKTPSNWQHNYTFIVNDSDF